MQIVGDVLLMRKHRLTELPFVPTVQWVTKLDPSPKAPQTAYGRRPAILMTATMFELPAPSTRPPVSRCVAQHAAAASAGTAELDAGEPAAPVALLELDRDALIAVDDDRAFPRLDRYREPTAGPA